MSFWFSQLVPPEIQARGIEAEHAFQRALKKGKVRVYRGRVMLIGQNRAGKTSLKKSLLGISFDPGEPSTDGIEVDPSKFEVDVDRVMNWQLVKNEKFTSEFADDIARLVVGELQKPEDQEEKPASSTVTENIQRDVTQGATAAPQGNQVLNVPLLNQKATFYSLLDLIQCHNFCGLLIRSFFLPFYPAYQNLLKKEHYFL